MKLKGLETKYCSAQDIYEGNIKLILGLIWRIILHFQLELFGFEGKNVKSQLLEFVSNTCEEFNCKIENFTTSFQSGVALCALIHSFDPSLIDMDEITAKSKSNDPNAALELNKKAILLAKENFKIPPIVEAEIITNSPEELSTMTYVSYYFEYFKKQPKNSLRNLNLTKVHSESFKKTLSRNQSLKSPKYAEILDYFSEPKIEEDEEVLDVDLTPSTASQIKDELEKLKIEKSILKKKLDETHSKLENEIQLFEINLKKIRSESKVKLMSLELENQKFAMEASQLSIIEFNKSLQILEEHNNNLQLREDELTRKLKIVEDQLIFLQADRDQRKKGRKGPEGEVTLVFTDVQDSTSLWEMSSTVMQKSLKIHNEEIRKVIEEINGFEVKTEGDAFMCAFDTAIDAINFALLVQIRLMEAKWPEEVFKHKSGKIEMDGDKPMFKGFRVRMGIHTGNPIVEIDPTTEREDYFGPMVNRSARVESQAKGGMIVISNSTYEKIKEKEFLFPIFMKDMGEVTLKGLKTPEHIRMILPESLSKRNFGETILDNEPSKLLNDEDHLLNLQNQTKESNSKFNSQIEEIEKEISGVSNKILTENEQLVLSQKKTKLLEAEIEKLKEEQKKLLSQTKSSGTNLTVEIEKLKDEMKDNEMKHWNEIESLNSTIKLNEIEKMKEIKEKENQISKLENQVKELKGEELRITKEINLSKETEKNLLGEISELKLINSSKANLELEVDELTKKCKEYEEEIKELESQEKQQKLKLKSLKSSLEEEELKNENLGEEVKNLKSNLKKVERNSEMEKEEFEEKIREIESKKEETNSEVQREEIKKIQETFQSQLQILNEANESIIENLKREKNEEIEKVKKENEKLKTQLGVKGIPSVKDDPPSSKNDSASFTPRRDRTEVSQTPRYEKKKSEIMETKSEDVKPKKSKSNYSSKEISLLQKWIEQVTSTTFIGEDFIDSLKDGTILCELCHKVKGRFIAYNKNPRGLDWMEKENVITFSTQCEKMGVKSKIEVVDEEHKDDLIKILFELSEIAPSQAKFKGPNINDLK
jgi:class 3 adenylate cyclase/ribosomal protein L24E